MSASEVAICNLALTKLKANRISALTDTSEEASACNAVYDLLRDEVTEAHPWNFAIKRAELGLLDEDAVYEDDKMTEVYSKPDDALRILEMSDTDATWKIEGDRILSDTAELSCKYIAKITDPTKFSKAYIQALASRIAGELAYSLTGSRALGGQYMDEYAVKLTNAKSIDAQEGTPQPMKQEDWIDARSE